MMGLNLMKPALGEKENESDEVSHGSPVFLICDGDSTVSVTSSPPFFGPLQQNKGGGGVCLHGNILRGRIPSAY